MAPIHRENAALVRRFLTDAIAGGDIDAVDGFLAPDVADHDLVFGGAQGPETVTTLGWQVLAAADVDVSIADVVATDDRVAVRGTVTGTHRESLMERAPTGCSFEITYAWFCRENGRIGEIWSLPDGLVRQLDAHPEGLPNRSLPNRMIAIMAQDTTDSLDVSVRKLPVETAGDSPEVAGND